MGGATSSNNNDVSDRAKTDEMSVAVSRFTGLKEILSNQGSKDAFGRFISTMSISTLDFKEVIFIILFYCFVLKSTIGQKYWIPYC